MNKYKVLMAESLTKLEEQVNNHLKRYYVLVGGIATDGKNYFQAMIKKESVLLNLKEAWYED